MEKSFYEIAVIGAGPAGLTSALYCRRSEKSVIVFEKDVVGGQVTHSPKIENYPGTAQMSGLDFAERLEEQVIAQEAEIENTGVSGITRLPDGLWELSLEDGESCRAEAVIIAAGVHHRTLGLEGEGELEGAGVSYCAVCDGAFYRGRTVAVIGGGNSALQEAVMLSSLCEKVFVLQNLDFFTGERALVKILQDAPNTELITGAVVTSLVQGGGELTAVRIEKSPDAERLSEISGLEDGLLKLDGVFVAIGLSPDNGIFGSVAPLDGRGYIECGENCELGDGLFTAGDCRTKTVRQITTAVSDGATAAVAACRYISRRSGNRLL